MALNRIASAVMFKALAMVSSFVNVVISGIVLPVDLALIYLAMLSAIQALIPFSGIGLAQRLVRSEPAVIQTWRVWPWFAISTFMVVSILYLQTKRLDAAVIAPIFLLCSIFAIHIAVSEYLRAGFARQTGFHVFNAGLFAVAILVLLQDGIGLIASVVASVALLTLLYNERELLFATKNEWPSFEFGDLRTAVRVSSVNQYYNLLVIGLTLIAPSPSLLATVLVWRFNIFFNWQTFYWLRFGHKDLKGRPSDTQRLENVRMIRLNILACIAACIVTGGIFFTSVGNWVDGTAFDRDFFALLLFYAVLRTTINLIFPYELFSIYTSTIVKDLKFFLLVGLTFGLIFGVAFLSTTPWALVVVVEAVALVWRLYCARTG